MEENLSEISVDDSIDGELLFLEILKKKANTLKRIIEESFEIKDRETSISQEIFFGYLHFISCLYVLPVIPAQMQAANYDKNASIEATALSCAFGCIISSYVTNLPFVIAPPTSVSIYVAVFMQQNLMDQNQGDTSVILSGFALLIIGVFKPLTSFVTKLIPDCIQASTAVGIGLITSLAGAIELELVTHGKYTLLEMGPITPSILIAIVSSIIIAICMNFHYKGAYISGLIFGTLVYWWYNRDWPLKVGSIPQFDFDLEISLSSTVLNLLLNLVFLDILTLNGIARSMSDLTGLTNYDGSIPRGNWLFIMCGLATLLSGYFSGPPILISPESAIGIKAGARTGLSTLVCGILFGLSVFLCPLFAKVPPSGTSPLLILVGMTLFINTSRIKWDKPSEAIPAFFVILLIPFTYSIICGIGFGYVFYISINLFTGELFEKFKQLFSTQSYSEISHQKQILKESNEIEGNEEIGNVKFLNDSIDSDYSQHHHLHSRRRNGSLVDRLPMDLETSISSMVIQT